MFGKILKKVFGRAKCIKAMKPHKKDQPAEITYQEDLSIEDEKLAETLFKVDLSYGDIIDIMIEVPEKKCLIYIKNQFEDFAVDLEKNVSTHKDCEFKIVPALFTSIFEDMGNTSNKETYKLKENYFNEKREEEKYEIMLKKIDIALEANQDSINKIKSKVKLLYGDEFHLLHVATNTYLTLDTEFSYKELDIGKEEKVQSDVFKLKLMANPTKESLFSIQPYYERILSDMDVVKTNSNIKLLALNAGTAFYTPALVVDQSNGCLYFSDLAPTPVTILKREYYPNISLIRISLPNSNEFISYPIKKNQRQIQSEKKQIENLKQYWQIVRKEKEYFIRNLREKLDKEISPKSCIVKKVQNERNIFSSFFSPRTIPRENMIQIKLTIDKKKFDVLFQIPEKIEKDKRKKKTNFNKYEKLDGHSLSAHVQHIIKFVLHATKAIDQHLRMYKLNQSEAELKKLKMVCERVSKFIKNEEPGCQTLSEKYGKHLQENQNLFRKMKIFTIFFQNQIWDSEKLLVECGFSVLLDLCIDNQKNQELALKLFENLEIIPPEVWEKGIYQEYLGKILRNFSLKKVVMGYPNCCRIMLSLATTIVNVKSRHANDYLLLATILSLDWIDRTAIVDEVKNLSPTYEEFKTEGFEIARFKNELFSEPENQIKLLIYYGRRIGPDTDSSEALGNKLISWFPQKTTVYPFLLRLFLKLIKIEIDQSKKSKVLPSPESAIKLIRLIFIESEEQDIRIISVGLKLIKLLLANNFLEESNLIEIMQSVSCRVYTIFSTSRLFEYYKIKENHIQNDGDLKIIQTLKENSRREIDIHYYEFLHKLMQEHINTLTIKDNEDLVNSSSEMLEKYVYVLVLLSEIHINKITSQIIKDSLEVKSSIDKLLKLSPGFVQNELMKYYCATEDIPEKKEEFHKFVIQAFVVSKFCKKQKLFSLSLKLLSYLNQGLQEVCNILKSSIPEGEIAQCQKSVDSFTTLFKKFVKCISENNIQNFNEPEELEKIQEEFKADYEADKAVSKPSVLFQSVLRVNNIHTMILKFLKENQKLIKLSRKTRKNEALHHAEEIIFYLIEKLRYFSKNNSENKGLLWNEQEAITTPFLSTSKSRNEVLLYEDIIEGEPSIMSSKWMPHFLSVLSHLQKKSKKIFIDFYIFLFPYRNLYPEVRRAVSTFLLSEISNQKPETKYLIDLKKIFENERDLYLFYEKRKALKVLLKENVLDKTSLCKVINYNYFSKYLSSFLKHSTSITSTADLSNKFIKVWVDIHFLTCSGHLAYKKQFLWELLQIDTKKEHMKKHIKAIYQRISMWLSREESQFSHYEIERLYFDCLRKVGVYNSVTKKKIRPYITNENVKLNLMLMDTQKLSMIPWNSKIHSIILNPEVMQRIIEEKEVASKKIYKGLMEKSSWKMYYILIFELFNRISDSKVGSSLKKVMRLKYLLSLVGNAFKQVSRSEMEIQMKVTSRIPTIELMTLMLFAYNEMSVLAKSKLYPQILHVVSKMLSLSSSTCKEIFIRLINDQHSKFIILIERIIEAMDFKIRKLSKKTKYKFQEQNLSYSSSDKRHCELARSLEYLDRSDHRDIHFICNIFQADLSVCQIFEKNDEGKAILYKLCNVLALYFQYLIKHFKNVPQSKFDSVKNWKLPLVLKTIDVIWQEKTISNYHRLLFVKSRILEPIQEILSLPINSLETPEGYSFILAKTNIIALKLLSKMLDERKTNYSVVSFVRSLPASSFTDNIISMEKKIHNYDIQHFYLTTLTTDSFFGEYGTINKVIIGIGYHTFLFLIKLRQGEPIVPIPKSVEKFYEAIDLAYKNLSKLSKSNYGIMNFSFLCSQHLGIGSGGPCTEEQSLLKMSHFYLMYLGRIEINNNGAIIIRYFPIRPESTFLRKTDKTAFLKQVQPEKPVIRMKKFLQYGTHLYSLMKAKNLVNKFANFPILSNICSWRNLWIYLSIFLVCVLNWCYLAEESTKEEEDGERHYILNRVSDISEYIFTPLQIILLICSCFIFFPMLAETIIELWYQFREEEQNTSEMNKLSKRLNRIMNSKFCWLRRIYKIILEIPSIVLILFDLFFHYYELLYHALFFSFLICSLASSRLWLTLHLSIVIIGSSTIKHLIRTIFTIKEHILALLGTVLLCMYWFAVFAYSNNLRDYYDKNTCDNLLKCFLVTLDQTFKNDGGIGPYTDNVNTAYKDGESINYTKILFDNFYNIIIIMLLLSAFSSVIINEFDRYSDEETERNIILSSECFVCGKSRADLDEKEKEGFQRHIIDQHNIWMYIHYIFFLKNTQDRRLDFEDQIAKKKIINSDTTWIPFYDMFQTIDTIILNCFDSLDTEHTGAISSILLGEFMDLVIKMLGGKRIPDSQIYTKRAQLNKNSKKKLFRDQAVKLALELLHSVRHT